MGSKEKRSVPGGCPCGSGDGFARCCAPLLGGEVEAATAVALMRARYSAHATGDDAFLVRSWHPDTCPGRVTEPGVRWVGLEVGATGGGRLLDRTGTVEFAASYERDGRRGVLRERSRFARLGTRWVYVDGEPW